MHATATALVVLPCSTVVLGVRENPPHIDPTSIKVDDSDHAIFVARDIKDSKLADLVCTAIEGAHVQKPLPAGLPGYLIPGPQRPFRIRMPGPKLPESPECNNTHERRTWLYP